MANACQQETQNQEACFKWESVLSNEAVEKAGFREGDDLEIKVDKGKKRIVVRGSDFFDFG